MAVEKRPPRIPGLTAGKMHIGKWSGGPARAWEYFLPSDARPLSKRISVFMKDDGIGSTVKVIEGDGRNSSFIEHAKIVLRDGACDEDVINAVDNLRTHLELAPAQNAEEVDEKLAAGILTLNGFYMDDLYGQVAWLKEADLDNFTFYLHGVIDPQFVKVDGREIVVPLRGPMSTEMPVEVGLVSGSDSGRCYCIAPCLEEGIRVILERLLPYPSVGEERVFDYEELIARPSNATRSPRM